jgi:GT2 family glycosyltransferase
VGFRIDLTPEQTEAFDESAVRRGHPPAPLEREQCRVLIRRWWRYEWALTLRNWGLGKAHKPKVLSANFSCTLGSYRAVNGFDEEYIGWGAEDDDLGRRMYASGVSPALGITKTIVYHQWHATRAPQTWHANAGAARFLKGTPVRALRGLDHPLEQPPVTVEHFGGAP